jgi:hypothetical protein
VAEDVRLLSDSEGHHDADKAPWAERKGRLLAQLAQPELPETVLRVAAADKLHNARSMLLSLDVEGPDAWNRFRSTPEDVVWFYRSVAELLAERYPQSANVAELGRAVRELAARVPEPA